MGMYGIYLSIDTADIERLVQKQLNAEDMDSDDYPNLDIDKSWHAIHFWLCGDSFDGQPPQGYIVPMLKDQALERDTYGAFYLYPQQVKEATDWLADMTDEQLYARYDFAKMMDESVYSLFEGEDEKEFYDYLYEYLQEIKVFYQTTAEKEQGILFFVS